MSAVDLQRQIDQLRAQVDYLTSLQQPNQNLSTGSSPTFAALTVTADVTAAALVFAAAGANLKAYTGTLADDASVSLTGEEGLFLLREHTGNTIALIRAAYGATGVAISSNITNLVFTDTDTNWCFFRSGGAYVLRNRNGASRDYTVIALSLS